MKIIKKDKKNYVLWSEVNNDFTEAKRIVYETLGHDTPGNHSINMDFHFILTDEQLETLAVTLHSLQQESE